MAIIKDPDGNAVSAVGTLTWSVNGGIGARLEPRLDVSPRLESR